MLQLVGRVLRVPLGMFPSRKTAWTLSLLLVCAHLVSAPGWTQGAHERHSYGHLPVRFEPNRGQSDPEVRFLARGADSVLLLTEQGAVLRFFAGQRHKQALVEASAAAALSMKLEGANPDARMEGEDRGAGVSHYLVGSRPDGWVRDVPLFGKVRYHEVYPGIDLVFYGNPQRLEYDFEVSPGADPGRIRLRFEGLERLELESNGDLRLTTAAGTLRQLRPVAYQPRSSGRQEVEAAFRLAGDAEIQFALGKYDPALPLVIDPVLDYSAIVGPGYAYAIAVGPDGSAYITGLGPPANLPTAHLIAPSEFQFLAFVAKLNPAGTEVLYSTFFDGIRPVGIALDPEGAPIVVGQTSSLNFPLVHPLQPELHGADDAFVAKLTPDGSAFVYATPLGGHSYEAAVSVVSDAAGNAYVGGSTASDDFPTVSAPQPKLSISGVFRTTNGGEQWTNATNNLGGRLVEGLAVSPDSADKVFAATEHGIFRTTDGGLTWRQAQGLPNPPYSDFPSVAIDPKNPLTVFAGGHRSALSNFFKSTDGGETWRATGQGLSGKFVDIDTLAIDPVNPANIYAGTDGGVYRSQDGGETFSPTTLHRQNMDWSQVAGINSISVAASSPMVVYVAAAFALFKSTDAGTTWNKLDAGEFNYAFQTVAADPTDAGIVYVSRYGGGPAILKSIDGGASWFAATAGLPDSSIGTQVRLVIDPKTPSILYAGLPAGGVFRSTDGAQNWQQRSDSLGDASVRSIAIAPSDPATVYVGNDVHIGDGFISKISSDGSRLIYSTYLGGASSDDVSGLALDQQGYLYVTGSTSSRDFPVRNAMQSTISGDAFSTDAFLLKLSPDGSDILYGTYLGGSREEMQPSVAVDGQGQAIVAGYTASPDFPTVQPLQGSLAGGSDGFVAKFAADGSSLVYSTYLGGSGDEAPAKVVADNEGRAYVTATTNSPDFPQAGDSFLACLADVSRDSGNIFVAVLPPSGVNLEQSLLIGGDGPDDVTSVALGPSGRVYLTGRTNSRIFPTARQGFLGERGAGLDGDVFALRLDLSQTTSSQAHLDCLTNAASFRPDPIAPGQIVSLFGERFGSGETVSFQPGPAGEIPRQLGGVRVLFDGVAAPLLFVSNRQINAIVPSDLAANAHTLVEVEYDDARSNPVRWDTAQASPAIFTLGDEGDFARAAVLNQDGTVNSVSNPAAPGSILSIFATGAGLMTPSLADDRITPLQPPWPQPDLPVEVTFFGEAGEVLYAGAAPGLVPGVLQINVRLPADLGPYDFYPPRLQIGDQANFGDGTPRIPVIAVK